MSGTGGLSVARDPVYQADGDLARDCAVLFGLAGSLTHPGWPAAENALEE